MVEVLHSHKDIVQPLFDRHGEVELYHMAHQLIHARVFEDHVKAKKIFPNLDHPLPAPPSPNESKEPTSAPTDQPEGLEELKDSDEKSEIDDEEEEEPAGKPLDKFSQIQLSYPTQHFLLTNLQTVVEQTLFEFLARHSPAFVAAKNWDCFEAATLDEAVKHMWVSLEPIQRRSKIRVEPPEWQRLLRTLLRLRNMAVHRARMNMFLLRFYVSRATRMAEILRDYSRADQLSNVLAELDSIIITLQKSTSSVQSEWRAKMDCIESERARLDSLEAEMMQELQTTTAEHVKLSSDSLKESLNKVFAGEYTARKYTAKEFQRDQERWLEKERLEKARQEEKKMEEEKEMLALAELEKEKLKREELERENSTMALELERLRELEKEKSKREKLERDNSAMALELERLRELERERLEQGKQPAPKKKEKKLRKQSQSGNHSIPDGEGKNEQKDGRAIPRNSDVAAAKGNKEQSAELTLQKDHGRQPYGDLTAIQISAGENRDLLTKEIEASDLSKDTDFYDGTIGLDIPKRRLDGDNSAALGDENEPSLNVELGRRADPQNQSVRGLPENSFVDKVDLRNSQSTGQISLKLGMVTDGRDARMESTSVIARTGTFALLPPPPEGTAAMMESKSQTDVAQLPSSTSMQALDAEVPLTRTVPLAVVYTVDRPHFGSWNTEANSMPFPEHSRGNIIRKFSVGKGHQQEHQNAGSPARRFFNPSPFMDK